MPTYAFVVFASCNFTDLEEMKEDLWSKHGDTIQKDGYDYWAGQGTEPGTFAYKIEQQRKVFGPERPPNNQKTTTKLEDNTVTTSNKMEIIVTWLDYYKYFFGAEEPLFLGTEGKFFDIYLQVNELMVGNDIVLKQFVKLANMNFCFLLPDKKMIVGEVWILALM